MFYEILTFFITIIGLIWITFKWRMRHIIRATKNMPGIESYPIVGSAHLAFGKNNEELFYAMKDIINQSWENPIKVWFGPVFCVIMSSAEDIHAITHSPNAIEKHYVYDFFNCNGLFSGHAKFWRKDRKILNPTFNIKILSSFISVFVESSKMMISNIEKHVGKKEFDISDYTFPFALDTICRTAMGYNLDVQQNQNTEFLESLLILSKILTQRVFKLWLHSNSFYRLTSTYRNEELHREKIFNVSRKIINEKKNDYIKMSDEEKNNILNLDVEYKKPQIFVNQLFSLATENKFSDEHIKDQVDTIVVSGTETSALTISYVLLMLAIYPEIQERVYQEVLDNYSKEETIDNTTLSNLVYLEMVIKETLRLYPIGPYIGRITTGDVKLADETILPAGISILISYYHLHRNPKIWGPNAEIFNPDNFLPENISKRHPSSFGGFSLGPRNCIGWRYAMMSMKILIAEFLLAYKVNTSLKPDKFRHSFDITLKLLNGYKISIVKRIE